MADLRTQLQKRFEPTNRFANFGNALVRLDVRGFRLHRQTVIEFRSPITAFCGPNGTGKTTLLQLAACAFKGENSDGLSLREFFAVGPLDPTPFSAAAQLGVSTWQNDAKVRTYTLARRGSRWSDYRARDRRPVLFLGAAHFLPRVEQQDFAFRNAGRLTVNGHTPCAADVSAAVARILGTHYDAIERAEVALKNRSDSILSSSRSGLRYSEHHMGFGECRVHNLVDTLEHVVEINSTTARLLSVSERTGHLFGKKEEAPTAKRVAKKKQMALFADLDEAATAQGWGEVGAPRAGTTTLDRVHQAMLLFGAGRGEALKRFLIEEGVGKQTQFWKLAQSLSALYPSGSDEKRWVGLLYLRHRRAPGRIDVHRDGELEAARGLEPRAWASGERRDEDERIVVTASSRGRGGGANDAGRRSQPAAMQARTYELVALTDIWTGDRTGNPPPLPEPGDRGCPGHRGPDRARAPDARGRQARRRPGLSEDERAFYDALETNDRAVKVLGDGTPRGIARELVATVRANVTIDWTVRENVRARLRVIVKRILSKHGYPPDKQEKATETVLQQAEIFWLS